MGNDQVKKPKFYKRKGFQVAAIFIIFFYIVGIISSSSDSKNNQLNSETNVANNSDSLVENKTVGIGDEVMLNSNEDTSICDRFMVIGITKDDEDEVVKLSVAEDSTGLVKMVLDNKAFMAKNCSKAKLIESTFTLRRVRILDGDTAGFDGWLPFEWVYPTK